jgi:hypothetical protein
MESKIKLYKALAGFQQECPVIHQGTKGYGYTYSSLTEILSIINPIMKKHNLGFTQLIQNDTIQTIVFETTTGQSIESNISVPGDVKLKGMNDFQVLGSAITYCRRYSISSILGIVTDKDIDGSGEQSKKPNAPAPAPAPAKLTMDYSSKSFINCKNAFIDTPKEGEKAFIDKLKNAYSNAGELIDKIQKLKLANKI